ncbi:MAG: hypothetical protein VR72_14240 [Clostridiaceae bacterium BRH_c20a]|nr:MAG: hypothetical protein VR72_14240 [Clostridiaceae bacterium BRH_c20a]
MQITKRIYLWLIITIVLFTVMFLIFFCLNSIKTSENHHKRLILNIAAYLGQAVNLSFSDILIREGAVGKPLEEQIAVINKNLQPIVNEVSNLFPGMGLGYYSIELDHIVAIAPNFNTDLLIQVPHSYSYFQSYESGKPEFGKSETSLGWFDKPILYVTYPIVHNDRIIGHSWANLPLDNMYKNIAEDTLSIILFVLLFMVAVIVIISTGFQVLRKELNSYCQHIVNSTEDISESAIVEFKPFFEEIKKSQQQLIIANMSLEQEIEERRLVEEKLIATLREVNSRKEEIAALFNSASLVLEMRDFKETARAIFDACKELTNATSGYVALLTEDGKENKLLFLDSGGQPCSVDPSLPMPIRGLRERAYLKGEVIYDNQFGKSNWFSYLPQGHMILDNVLFSPLVLKGKTLGILGLANKPGGFTEEDKHLTKGFSDMVAIALRNSRSLSRLTQSTISTRKAAYTASDPIIAFSTQGLIAFCNEAFKKLFQYSYREVWKKPINLLIPRISELMAANDLDRIKGAFDAMGLKKDGTSVSLEISLGVWGLEDDKWYIAFIRDNSERRLLEEKRRYYLFEDFPEIIFFTDEDENIIQANKKAVRYYGYSMEELKTLNIKDLSHHGETFINIKGRYDSIHRRKDGTVFPVEVSCFKTISENKTIKIFSLRDISERMENENKIRNSEEKIKKIFNSAPVGICLVNKRDEVVECNQMMTKILGYSEEELSGMTYYQYTHPEDKELTGDFTKEVLSEPYLNRCLEKRYIHKDGHIIWARVFVAVLIERNDEINRIVIIEDTTSQKELESELITAREKSEISARLAALGTMAASIAHEVNQPLNTIRVAVEGLLYFYRKDQLLDIEEVAETLADISTEVVSIADIINNMKLFINNERIHEDGLCDLNLILNKVVEKNIILAQQENILISSKFNYIPPIKGNVSKLTEIFNNVLINAIEALKRSEKEIKEIEITTTLKETVIKVEISDNGLGITADVKHKLFDPFFTTKKAGEGMGIGLTIVYVLLESMGATINAVSNEKGGATFKLDFPLEDY